MNLFTLLTTFISIIVVTIASSPSEATPTKPVPLQQLPRYCLREHKTTHQLSVGSVAADPNDCPDDAYYQDSFGNFKIRATAFHAFNTSTSGWDFLEIVPDYKHDLKRAYYDAGYLEGFLTAENLTMINVSNNFENLPWKNVSDFIVKHVDYMNTTSQAQASSDKFWQRVGFILDQLRGQMDGYNLAVSLNKAGSGSKKQASFYDLFLASYYFELMDIKSKFRYRPPQKKKKKQQQEQQDEEQQQEDEASAPYRVTHCSALIKITDTDAYLAHTSWFIFENMRRIHKRYHFDTSVSMSSYVGFVHSGDDFYVTSNSLAVTETSLSVFNFEKLSDKILETQVSEFIRVMAANYLATGGEEWSSHFSRHNSGTYNNEFSVLDFKKYSPRKNAAANLPDGTLWVAEQLPGLVVARDITAETLRKYSYFGSYNQPFYAQIDLESGAATERAKFGDFFSYWNTTRANIFRRNHSMISSVEDVQKMMRYNHFHIDPLSTIPNCSGTIYGNNTCKPDRSGQLAIANRGDLSPLGNRSTLGPLWNYMARGDITAYDAKVSSYKMSRTTLETRIISGPPVDEEFGITPFSFTKNVDLFPKNMQLPPVGLPDTWNFPWVAATLMQIPPTKDNTGPKSIWSNKQSVGAIIGGILGVIGVLLVVIYQRRNASRHKGGNAGASSSGKPNNLNPTTNAGDYQALAQN